MITLKPNSPLFIPIREFDSFEDYFQSLTKSCRNSLTLPKQERLMDGLQYRKLGWDEDTVRYFMDLWEKQSIHFGTPKWPDGWLEHMKDLNSRENFDMFGMLKGDEIISVHFVFVFNDYIYCNSPLYDKNKYDKISLGRLMWYNLIRFGIENTKWAYIDLDGNGNGDTFKEVIQNKVPPGTPGDFGYKWFFIPEKIKNLDDEYKQYYNNHISVVDGWWKGLDIDHHKIVLDNDWLDGFDEKIKYDMSLYLEEFEIEDGDVVVDLGASTGLFTLEAAKKASKVYSVEPFPEMLEVLRPRVENLDNVIVDEIPIGSGRDVEFEVNGAVQGERRYVDKSQSFMDFVKKHNIKKIDYLKIDIENAEYYIFSDLDKDDYHQRLDWIKNNVKKLVVEIDSSMGRYLGKDREIHSNPQAQHFIDYVVPYLGGKTWARYCSGPDISENGANEITRYNGEQVTMQGGWRNSQEFTKYMHQFMMYIDFRKEPKHHFYIRNYDRLPDLHLLLEQLKSIDIKTNQITLLTTWNVEGEQYKLNDDYKVVRRYNSGYQQGDADLINDSLNMSDPNKINHYMNAGQVIYDKDRFKNYLKMTENSDDIIHISRGNDLLDNEYESNLGSTNLNELATGMIISSTGDGIDILKNCYHEDYIGWREVDLKGDPIYISYYQKYLSHNGKGSPFLRFYPSENPFINDQDKNEKGGGLYIEYYFFQKIWEQTNFRLVNFTDNYRGIHLRKDSEKTTRDWLLNREAGVIRLSKYDNMGDVNETMFNIIKEEKFYEEVGFYKPPTEEKVMDKSNKKNLLLVSHMDDETIFFGNWLFLNGKDTKVIVTCEPSTNEEKEDSFKKVMNYCNVSDYEMWNWEESLNGYADFDRLKNKIKDECEVNDYENVVTHNSYGEYGHIQHQQLNEIMTEALYESVVSNFWVYDLHPLALEYRGYNANPKEDMLNMYPEQERVNTIEKMRRCESTWYDHCKPAKWGSKYVGGGNLIDYESLRLIERPYEQKLNIGLIREEPTLNNNYSNSFRGEFVKASEEEEKFDEVYSSPTNDFLKTIESYFSNHNVEYVDTLDDFDDFVGLTNETKQMYIAVTTKSAMICHKLGLPYMFFANFSDGIPIEIKSSASRIIYPSHSYGVSQFNETVIDFSRHHHVVRYDLHGQLHRAVIMYKRHNIKTTDIFSFFQIEDDSNPESLGKLHMKLKVPEYEGFYFIEGMDIQSGDVVCNWKVDLSTTNQIWVRSDLTQNVINKGLVLRFWKDPIKCEEGDGLHPEPHNHDYLPDWKIRKARYPEFSLIIPKMYETREWQ